MPLSAGTAIILLNWRLRHIPGHFATLMFLSQQAKKGITALQCLTSSNFQGEIRLLLYREVKYKYENIGDLLGYLLVLPYPISQINEKLKQPHPGRMINGPGLLRIKLWVSL